MVIEKKGTGMMKAAVKETAILRNGVEMPLVGLGVMCGLFVRR